MSLHKERDGHMQMTWRPSVPKMKDSLAKVRSWNGCACLCRYGTCEVRLSNNTFYLIMLDLITIIFQFTCPFVEVGEFPRTSLETQPYRKQLLSHRTAHAVQNPQL